MHSIKSLIDEHMRIESKRINGYENENRSIILGSISKDKSMEKKYDRIISIKENQRLRNRESIDYSYSIAKDKR